jgi:hypothetical protein
VKLYSTGCRDRKYKGKLQLQSLTNFKNNNMESIKSSLFEKFKFDELKYPERIQGGTVFTERSSVNGNASDHRQVSDDPGKDGAGYPTNWSGACAFLIQVPRNNQYMYAPAWGTQQVIVTNPSKTRF